MIVTRLFSGLAAALFILPVAALAKPAAAPKHAKPSPAKTTPSASPATEKAADIMLYNGASASTAGVTLTAWGGGSASDSTSVAFAKTNSIKITTIDPYQGAKITFNTPVNLGDLADKTRYLAFTLRQTASTSPAAQPQLDANNGNPEFPGQQMRFRRQFAAPAITPIHDIHLMLTLANGANIDLMRPLPQTGDPQANINQWINFAVPLSSLGFPAADAGSALQSITVAGDEYAVLYVGQIKLTHDTTPLTCFAGDEQSVEVDQPVTLQGSASGGLSTLHYAWDLQTKGQFVEQASGPAVTIAYPKPGDYKITLTVSDIDGIKKPATSTTVVHVQ